MLNIRGIAFTIQLQQVEEKQHWLEPIQALLQEFGDAFQLPQGLPLQRVCNHCIPLINPQQPVKVRLYHYPFY